MVGAFWVTEVEEDRNRKICRSLAIGHEQYEVVVVLGITMVDELSFIVL